jgi:hypothetical protein
MIGFTAGFSIAFFAFGTPVVPAMVAGLFGWMIINNMG